MTARTLWTYDDYAALPEDGKARRLGIVLYAP